MQLILPLIAAIAFAAGSMVFKRAFAEGASLSHAVVVNNVNHRLPIERKAEA